MGRRRICLGHAIAAALAAAALQCLAAAQSPQPTIDRNLAPASNRVPAAGTSSSQSVRFTRRPAQVGDQVDQTIARDMSLTTAERRGASTTEKGTRTMRSRQVRSVVTTSAENGRTQGVLVCYREASKHIEPDPANAVEHAVAADAMPATGASSVTSEPVAGKTYRCWRKGDNLVVTDDQGRVPPPAELEIVAADMEPVGRPNPFADYLAGRTVSIGETLNVPVALAGRLVALDERVGKVTQFSLTLREVINEAPAAHAVFAARIEAASISSSQMRLDVAGTLAVEIDTCRAVGSSLSGPLIMSESRGSYSTAYQIITTGKLSMSIASTYRDAPAR